MNNLKSNILKLLIATTSLAGCKNNTELRLVEFKGIYPTTPAYEPYCELYFLDAKGKRTDSTTLAISDQVSEDFRLRFGTDSIWKAPNRFAVAEIAGEKNERTVTKAIQIDSSKTLLNAWQKRIEQANGDPDKIFTR